MWFRRILIAIFVLVVVPLAVLVVDRQWLGDLITSRIFTSDPRGEVAAPSATPGFIHVDSPEIYTRERLVNDRYQQDAWLQGRLQQADQIEFGVQGVRDIRAATQLIAQMKVGVAIPTAAGGATKADLPKTPDNAGGVEPSAAATDDPKTTKDRSPIDDFRDRAAYREEIRSAIIENQLDDRHDLDGNTLYRLKLDATVVPSINNTHRAKIDVTVRPRLDRPTFPDGYDKAWPMEHKARFLQTEWVRQHGEATKTWRQVYDKYLDSVTQVLTSQLEWRIEALKEIVESEENPDNWGIETKRDIRNLAQSIEYALAERITENDRSEVGISTAKKIIDGCNKQRKRGWNLSAVNAGTIASMTCLIAAAERDGRSSDDGKSESSEEFLSLQIASVIWPSIKTAFERNRSKALTRVERSLQTTSQIEELYLENGLQVARAQAHESIVTLFDIDHYKGNSEQLNTFGVSVDDLNDSDKLLFCRDTHPEIFAAVDQELRTSGYTMDVFKGSPIVRLDSFDIKFDKDGETLKCFDTYLDYYRSDGFIAFLERFKNHSKPPAYSYAITPKESTQRLSDSFDQHSATSALAAVALSAGILKSESSLAVNDDLRQGFSGISRHPLVVGYSGSAGADTGSTLGFGWVIAPRWHPGQDSSAPTFKQTLTQQSLSAVISVPAWWPSVDIDITTTWLNDDAQLPANTAPITTTYEDVRLPGDLDEILRILYPNLNKAPKIDRLRMQMSYLHLPAPDKGNDTASASGQKVELIIPGRNLWRSTVVTLGAMRAEQIWVMPNMGGLIAQFPSVPNSNRGNPITMPLRVWTSDGVDTVHNKVCILPAGADRPTSCGIAAAAEIRDGATDAAGKQTQGTNTPPEQQPARLPPDQSPETPSSTPQMTQLAALVDSVSFFASAGEGAAIIPDARGQATITIRSQDLAQLADDELSVEIALVGESEYGQTDVLGAQLIENLGANLIDGSFTAKIDLPGRGEGLAAIENGQRTRLVLRVSDKAGNVKRAYSTNSLVYYADSEKATIRLVGRDLELNPETLQGVFEMVLPARVLDAFPDTMGAGAPLFVAKVRVGDQEKDIFAEIEPLIDISEEESNLQQELRVPFVIELSEADGKTLKEYFMTPKVAPIAFRMKYGQPDIAWLPKISGEITIKGFAEPASK